MTDWKSFETITVEQDSDFTTVTINRPKSLNALNAQVISELGTVVNSLANSDHRGFIVQSAGDKAFVAGADIVEMSDLSPQQALEFARLGQALTRKIEELPCLTIAVVQGFALGGGCELAMACDVIVAGENALFGQPEVNLGLVPGFGGTQRLMARLGPGVGFDVLCCGRNLKASEAFQVGLVARVVPNEKLNEEIEKIKKALKKAGPIAIRSTKKLARNASDMSLSAGLESEAQTFSNLFQGEEAKEGMQAFINKTKPSFCV